MIIWNLFDHIWRHKIFQIFLVSPQLTRKARNFPGITKIQIAVIWSSSRFIYKLFPLKLLKQKKIWGCLEKYPTNFWPLLEKNHITKPKCHLWTTSCNVIGNHLLLKLNFPFFATSFNLNLGFCLCEHLSSNHNLAISKKNLSLLLQGVSYWNGRN